MRRILITGGPVHAHIDDVKIVTNRFRGGLMAALAKELATRFDCQVTYLTAPGAEVPLEMDNGAIKVIRHAGYYDYRAKVAELAPLHTDVIMGAAVANLIPKNPIKGKFPSHNYNEGDTVSIEFLVTPRVITEVKKAAPHVNLFGFKLLSGAPHEELVKAAWHTLVSSKALSVIANDATDLQTIYAITKEGGEHKMARSDLAQFLWTLMNEQFYRTQEVAGEPNPPAPGLDRLKALIEEYRAKPGFFVETPDGMVFGTVAVKAGLGRLWTTGRGKRELESHCFVQGVDHDKQVVFADGKASLNAPLLHQLLYGQAGASAVVHGHFQHPDLKTLPYATPGTVRDSVRAAFGSFNIAGHGCFLLLDEQGNVLPWKEPQLPLELPLKAGLSYIRRNGERATVDRIDRSSVVSKHGIAVFDRGQEVWASNGRYDDERESEHDVIATAAGQGAAQ